MTASPLVQTEGLKPPGKAQNLLQEFTIGEFLDRVRDRAVVDQRNLVRAALLHVPVECVPARVQLAALVPAIERGLGFVEHLVPLPVPSDRACSLGPEPLRVGDASRKQVLILAHVETSQSGQAGAKKKTKASLAKPARDAKKVFKLLRINPKAFAFLCDLAALRENFFI